MAHKIKGKQGALFGQLVFGILNVKVMS